MTERINEPVSVICIHRVSPKRVMPWKIKWRQKTYTINHIGLHHTITKGRTLHHIFSATTGNLFLRLSLNSESLIWTLEEVSDGVTS